MKSFIFCSSILITLPPFFAGIISLAKGFHFACTHWGETIVFFGVHPGLAPRAPFLSFPRFHIFGHSRLIGLCCKKSINFLRSFLLLITKPTSDFLFSLSCVTRNSNWFLLAAHRDIETAVRSAGCSSNSSKFLFSVILKSLIR